MVRGQLEQNHKTLSKNKITKLEKRAGGMVQIVSVCLASTKPSVQTPQLSNSLIIEE
jgi:hypothetical protein